MVVFKDSPPYPVLDSQPTYGTVIFNMRLTDWGITFGLGVVGMAWGYIGGKPIRKPMMWLGGTVGLLAGHLLATQNSAFRLLGWRNNEAERRRLNHPVPLATSGDKQ